MPDANGKPTAAERAADGAKKGSIGGPYGAIFGGIDGYFNGPLYKTTVPKGADGAGGMRRTDEIAQLLGLSGDVFRTAGRGDILAGQRQLDFGGQFFDAALDRYPELARREREATNQQHAWDVNDMRTNGVKMQALIEKMAPELKNAGDAISRLLTGVGQDSELLASLNKDALTQGMSPINARLSDAAQHELDLGGTLSPDQIRNIQQDSRAGYSARGMLGSDMGAIEEVMNLGGARQARERERQSFASQINQLLLGERAQNREFGMGVEGLNQRGTALDTAIASAGMAAGGERLAPMLGFMRQRAAVNPLGAGQMMAMAPNTIGASDALLRLLIGGDSLGKDIFDTNANAASAARIAAANNNAAITGAAINAGGKIAGSYFNSGTKSGTGV